ncbi:MAG TPA: hypothetical protein VI756_32420, partial [Blastocatellia bacterium]
MGSGLNSDEFAHTAASGVQSDRLKFEDALDAALSGPADRATALRLIHAQGDELELLLKAAVEL